MHQQDHGKNMPLKHWLSQSIKGCISAGTNTSHRRTQEVQQNHLENPAPKSYGYGGITADWQELLLSMSCHSCHTQFTSYLYLLTAVHSEQLLQAFYLQLLRLWLVKLLSVIAFIFIFTGCPANRELFNVQDYRFKICWIQLFFLLLPFNSTFLYLIFTAK